MEETISSETVVVQQVDFELGCLIPITVLSSNVQIFTGWKEIANHMNHGVRTVQRWELVGLPVHRPKLLGSATAVIAFAEELDAWMEIAPIRADVVRDLQSKIDSLETEVRALRSELARILKSNQRR